MMLVACRDEGGICQPAEPAIVVVHMAPTNANRQHGGDTRYIATIHVNTRLHCLGVNTT